MCGEHSMKAAQKHSWIDLVVRNRVDEHQTLQCMSEGLRDGSGRHIYSSCFYLFEQLAYFFLITMLCVSMVML